MTSEEREQLRHWYRPEQIRVLFIGESPPHNCTFFYSGDSNLYNYTREAFQKLYDKQWGVADKFLRFFQGSGCYLDDLCHDPVNQHGNSPERKAQRRRSIPLLAERIKKAEPDAVITVMKGICEHSERAMSIAGVHPMRKWCLRFPAQGNQRHYVKELCVVLKELGQLRILP